LGEQLNVHPEALRNWVRQAEADAGRRHDRPTTDMLAENRRLARENAELLRVNEVLRAASAYLASEIGGLPTARLEERVDPAEPGAHRRPGPVEHDFRVSAPNRLWVADLTRIITGEAVLESESIWGRYVSLGYTPN
jgi:transposase